MSEVNIISPISTCRANLQCIQDTLDEVCPTDAPTRLLTHIGELASLIGLSANTQASLKFHYVSELGTGLIEAKKIGMPPSMMKEYAESRMSELVSNYELSERLNRAMVHKIDALRSCLSYLKAENFHANTQPS